MKTKLYYLIALLLITTFQLIGQTEKGIRIAAGFSIIEDDPERGADRYTEKIAPSFNIGYVSNFNLTEKLILGSAIEFNSILTKETYNPDHTVNKYVNYLSLPLTLDLNLSNFRIGIGIRNSLKLFGGGKDEGAHIINGQEEKGSLKLKGSEYRLHDWGPMIKLDCSVSKKVRISWFYYRGFANIHSEDSIRGRVKAWKARQMTLGITYLLKS